MEEKKNKVMLMGVVIGERKRSSTSSSTLMMLDLNEEDSGNAKKPSPFEFLKKTKNDRKKQKSETNGYSGMIVPRPVKDIVEKKYGRNIEFMFLASKKLVASDVNKDLRRFIFPKTKGLSEALTREEKRILGMYEDNHGREKTDEKIETSIRVVVVDPKGREYYMVFRKEPNADQIVLGPGWIQIVSVNSLKEDHIVDFWSFRVDSKLYFIVGFEKNVKLDLSLSL